MALTGKQALTRSAAILAVAAFWAVTFAPIWQRVLDGYNDFPFFYCGGKNAFSATLYHAKPCHDAQVGMFDGVTYSRLPFHALAFWPISWLPYHAAYGIFQLLQMAAIVWAVRSIARERADFLFLACFSPGLLMTLADGEDTGFLFALTVAVWQAVRRNQDVRAGLLLALCAIKPHLFVLMPIVFGLQRRWRVIAAAAGGIVGLLAISFLSNGLDWPWRFLAAISNPRIDSAPSLHVSLHNLALYWAGGSLGFEMIGSAVIACGVAYLSWRQRDISIPYAVALAMGLLTGHHVYLQDTTLALAAFGILSVVARDANALLPVLALAALPPSAMAVILGWPFSIAYPLMLIVAFAIAVGVPFDRKSAPEPSAAPA